MDIRWFNFNKICMDLVIFNAKTYQYGQHLNFNPVIMRNSHSRSMLLLKPIVLMIGFISILISCNPQESKQTDNSVKSEQPNEEIIWHIKAIHPDGYSIDVKALDKDGNKYDVKAIQNSDQTTMMGIKALVNGEKIPVKMLVSSDKLVPVKAIMPDGTILDVKAIMANGDILDVKGTRRSGNIIDVKAVSKEGRYYGVKAISSEGNLNDVKGIKMFNENLEANVNGIEVFAHVKAITQAGCSGDNFIWHIKAFKPNGEIIDVKALDQDGNIYPVKAIKNTKQRSLLDVKVYISGSEQLPVKILVSNDKYAPVKAIAADGSIYDIKALTKDGRKLDVKGVSKSGNLYNIKSINEDGDFYGIKAISPDGDLNDVKGVKMISETLEYNIGEIEIAAHIKALPQKY